ncbi:MAG: phage portal protein [Gammaproteobacteria bacterium]|nr:phage portal protein [Gammaproteobacteria bacterium]
MGIRQWVTDQIAEMGFLKADDRSGVSISTVLQGEAPRFGPLDVPVLDDEAQQRTERLAVTSPWAFSDAQLITREFSRADFYVEEQGGDGKWARIEGHEFETLFSRPNPDSRFMDRSFVLQYTAWWLLVRGEAYWWQVEDLAGDLARLMPVPASRMNPIPDPETYIAGFLYTPRHGQKPTSIPVEKTCFFRTPNIFDYHRGLSPLSAAKLELETDYAAAKWNRETFIKEAALRLILGLSRDLSRPDYIKAKTELEEELIEKNLRYVISRAGDITPTALDSNHKDLEYLEGRIQNREAIDRTLGVTAGFWAKEASKANTEAARATLIEFTIHPMHVATAEAITSQIIIPRYGEGLRGRFEDIRPRDRKLLVVERRQYWQVKTVDEARGDLGLTELDDAELGGTLVPLATKPQGAPVQEGQPFMSALPVNQELLATQRRLVRAGDERAARQDLRRWQSVALRRLGKGEEPGGYDFVSEYIPTDVATNVKAALAEASTYEEVKAAFAATFCGCGEADHDHRREDWEAYP